MSANTGTPGRGPAAVTLPPTEAPQQGEPSERLRIRPNDGRRMLRVAFETDPVVQTTTVHPDTLLRLQPADCGNVAALAYVPRNATAKRGSHPAQEAGMTEESTPLGLAAQSIDLIHLSNVLEALPRRDGGRLLHTCRVLLKPGGSLRITTQDLAATLEAYNNPDAWDATFHTSVGYDWTTTRANILNQAMRAIGHKWLYEIESLRALARLYGLRFVRRCAPCETNEGRFDGVEPLNNPFALIAEFVKPAYSSVAASPAAAKLQRPEDHPKISILIPLYDATYFAEALTSALEQTYPNIEVIICDDHPNTPGRAIAERLQREHARGSCIHYEKNSKHLGDAENYVRCLERSQGDYLKILNCDDRLHPECVTRMVSALQAYPQATLVFSSRQVISADGTPVALPVEQTLNGIGQDALLDGIGLIQYAAGHQFNVIGEPTSTMFRRTDVEGLRPNLWSLCGVNVHGNGDMTLWANLLCQGHAVYLAEPMADFRFHPAQVSAQPGVQTFGSRAWDRLTAQLEEVGVLREDDTPRPLLLAPIPVLPWWPAAIRQRVEEGRHAWFGQDNVAALAAMQEAHKHDPDCPRLNTYLAEAQRRSGDLVAALRRLNDVITRYPNYRPARLKALHATYQAGNRASAEHRDQLLAQTQSATPIFRMAAGVSQDDTGQLRLGQQALFELAADLPPIEIRLTMESARPDTAPLYAEIWVNGRREQSAVLRQHQPWTVQLIAPTSRDLLRLGVTWRAPPELIHDEAPAQPWLVLTRFDMALAPPPVANSHAA